MPELKTVLPSLIEDRNPRNTQAYEFRNQQVSEIKLATGAPCSSHDDLFEPWPGTETNITEWYVLENGYAVGKGTDPDGDDIFPVVMLGSESV